MRRHSSGLGQRQLARACVAAFLVGVSTGCYSYVPAPAGPMPGMDVAVRVNDRGRVALADSIGPSVDRIEGSVQSSSDSTLYLRITSVQYINGQSTRWGREPLAIRSDFMGDIRQKQFSRSRTMALAGAAVAGLVALIVSRELVGGGNVRGDTPPGGEKPDQ